MMKFNQFNMDSIKKIGIYNKKEQPNVDLHAPGHSYGRFCKARTCLDNEYFKTLKCKVGPSG